MAKLFFFPTFAKLRGTGWGQPLKVAVATAVVFIATTILHAYQTFWLRGSFAIHETDYWFWGILGFLVIANNWWNDRRRPVRRPVAGGFSWRRAGLLSLRVVGMFLFLCLLWALWNSRTLDAFFGVIRQAVVIELSHLAVLGGFCVAGIVLGTLGQWVAHHGIDLFAERPGTLRSVASVTLPMACLAIAWHYHSAYGIAGTVGAKFDAVHVNLPSANDQMMKERSYYQGLMGGVASVGAEEEGDVKDLTDDVRVVLYKERFGPEEVWGARWSTNRWRMRDKNYSKRKAAGTYRIALGGASYVMGRGVDDGENFESVLEKHLNAEGIDVEILNFAMSATCTLQRVADLELRVAEFEPDAFYLVCHGDEALRNLRKLAGVIAYGKTDLTYDFLKEIVAEAGVACGDAESDIIRALTPHADVIMEKTYARLAEVCAGQGIRPVWVFLPMLRTAKQTSLAEEGLAYARRAGIETLVLEDVYGDLTIPELSVSDVDFHPNPLGHRLIARALLIAMQEKAEAIGLPPEIGEIVPPE